MATIKKGTYKFNKTIASIPSTIQLPYEFYFSNGGEGYTDIYLADNVLQWRAGEGSFVNNVYNYETQTWEYDSERVIIVDTPQTVSKDFYEWFDANIEHQTLKGKWKFRKELTGFSPSISIEQTVNFTCNGREQGGFRLYGAGLDYLSPCGSGNGLRYNWIDGGFWTGNDTYRTVDFGETEQNVSQEFYDWFINNANEMSVIKAGTYTFNDTLTAPLAVTSYGYIYASPMSFRIVGGTYDLVSGSAMENGGSNFSVMLSELGWVDIYNYSSGWVGGEALKVSISEDFRTADSLGIAFAIWFNTDTEFTSEKVYYDTSITYAGRAIANLGEGHIATLVCADKTMLSDVTVASNELSEVAVIYKGRVIAHIPVGNSIHVLCNGKQMATDLTVMVNGKPSEGLAFKQGWDGSNYLSGIGTCTDTNVVIPLVTPAGSLLTRISSNAFRECENLTSVVIPVSITQIDANTFYSCTSLTSIVIPSGVTEISNSLFYSCTSLTSVVLGDGVTSIGENAFCRCINLPRIVIPDGVTSIGYHAFYECEGLTSMIIPDSVISIGKEAFIYCRGLTSVVLGDGVETLEPETFGYCTSLSEITLGRSLTSIDTFAFRGCYRLASIVVDEDNTAYKSIDGNLYTKDGKTLIRYATGKMDTSFTIPDGVTSIGKYAFYDCDENTKLTTITIPSSVTSIDEKAFSQWNNASNVYISTINVPWAEGVVPGAPWGASYPFGITINYNYKG